jgi:predicted RNA binding protein YcfA (HicA-like mRNA interferase family)
MTDLLDQMRRNPQANWTIKDVEKVCSENGVLCTAPKRGSHYKVSHQRFIDILTIPFKRPIKTVYIRRLVIYIDAARKLK